MDMTHFEGLTCAFAARLVHGTHVEIASACYRAGEKPIQFRTLVPIMVATATIDNSPAESPESEITDDMIYLAIFKKPRRNNQQQGLNDE